MGDDGARLARHDLLRRERGDDLRHVMPVDFLDRPAEGRELGREGGEIVGIRQPRALLQAVVVDDQRQVVELVLRGRRDGFPVRALLHLPVAGDDIGLPRRMIELGGNRHADAHGQPMPERAGVGFHPRHLGAVGVAVEARMRLEEGLDLLLRDETLLRERDIERAGGMPLAQDEAVATGIERIGGIDVEDAEIERRQDVDHRHLAADMPRTRLEYRAEVAPADRIRHPLQLLDGHLALHELGLL